MKKDLKEKVSSNIAPAEEAQRYLDNAKEILREKAGKKDGLYADVKYVKMASGTAYSAALLILDEFLKRKEGDKFVKPKSIEDYTNRIRKYDKKLLRLLVMCMMNCILSDTITEPNRLIPFKRA